MPKVQNIDYSGVQNVVDAFLYFLLTHFFYLFTGSFPLTMARRRRRGGDAYK